MFLRNAYANGITLESFSELSVFIPIFIIFIIMYFLVIRPQKIQMKKHLEMINSIKKGDIIITGGGIISKVYKLYDNSKEIEVEISDGIYVKIMKNTIHSIYSNKNDTIKK